MIQHDRPPQSERLRPNLRQLAGRVALSMVAAVGVADMLPAASAEAASHRAMTSLPYLQEGKTSFMEAKGLLKQNKLKLGGAILDGKPLKITNAVDFVAESWMKKTVKKVKSHGKVKVVTKYSPLLEGKKMKAGSKVWVGVGKKPAAVQPEVKTPPVIETPDLNEEPKDPLPVQPQPETPKPNPTPETQPPVDARAEAEKAVRNSARKFESLDASSAMDIGGVAAVTAAHVISDDEIIKGPDNRLYAVMPKGLDVKQGSDAEHMKTVAQADRLLLPAEGDFTSDAALLIYKGRTVTEAKQALAANTMSIEEAAALGGTAQLMLAGYPLYGNSTSKLEVFTTSILGMGKIFGSNNQTRNALMGGMKAGPDTKVPTIGASGGGGAVFETVKGPDGRLTVVIRILRGIISAADDFRKEGNTLNYGTWTPEQVKKSREASFGMDLSGVDYISYIASAEPAANGRMIYLVKSYDEIPKKAAVSTSTLQVKSTSINSTDTHEYGLR